MALVDGENLGKDEFTDFLAISYSSTDIVGHAYGPSSIETEDCYLRLDRELETLFRFLDDRAGKGRWLCFLTADHGVMDVPGFLQSKSIPAYTFSEDNMLDSLRQLSVRNSGKDWLAGFENLQLIWKPDFFRLEQHQRDNLEAGLIRWLENQPSVLRAFSLSGKRPWPEPPFLDKVSAAWFPGRSGHIQVLLKAPYLNQASEQGTTHGSAYAYDSQVPCLWMGWKIAPGEDVRPVAIEDIAPTLSSLLHIGLPNAATGKALYVPLK
jgi:predicted AlkP superfamily pyrophosphatase or phosphodiesterase